MKIWIVFSDSSQTEFRMFVWNYFSQKLLVTFMLAQIVVFSLQSVVAPTRSTYICFLLAQEKFLSRLVHGKSWVHLCTRTQEMWKRTNIETSNNHNSNNTFKSKTKSFCSLHRDVRRRDILQNCWLQGFYTLHVDEKSWKAKMLFHTHNCFVQKKISFVWQTVVLCWSKVWNLERKGRTQTLITKVSGGHFHGLLVQTNLFTGGGFEAFVKGVWWIDEVALGAGTTADDNPQSALWTSNHQWRVYSRNCNPPAEWNKRQRSCDLIKISLH